jgi:peptidyl-tRNA hydrolase, PTH1 family
MPTAMDFFRKLFAKTEADRTEPMAKMKTIVGLGNPGPQYARNRHNIGFQIVELFARRHQIELGKMQHKARLGDGWVQQGGQREKVLLIKPLTFMNNSGEAVAPLVRYYDIDPADMLVIMDDLDLASGTLRLRPNGSSGGQNGLKSIIRLTGTQEFPRLRVGIGRPPGRMDPANYVLQNFSTDEEDVFGHLRERIADAIECWIFEGVEAAMNKYNG